MTDHRAGRRPKGICPECLELRHLDKHGHLGAHRRVYRRHYRGSTCPGVGQLSAWFGPDPDWDD